MTDVGVGSGALLGRSLISLFRQLPLTMDEPPEDQEIGDCYVRPGIERMPRSSCVMRRDLHGLTLKLSHVALATLAVAPGSAPWAWAPLAVRCTSDLGTKS